MVPENQAVPSLERPANHVRSSDLVSGSLPILYVPPHRIVPPTGLRAPLPESTPVTPTQATMRDYRARHPHDMIVRYN